MPRGQKSKIRSRQKRREARNDTQILQGAQGTATAQARMLSLVDPLREDDLAQNRSADALEELHGAATPTTTSEEVSEASSDEDTMSQDAADGDEGWEGAKDEEGSEGEKGSEGTADGASAAGAEAAGGAAGAEGPRAESPESSQSYQRWHGDPLNRKVVQLVRFLIQKYHRKELITKADMIKHVIKKYKYHFNEILKRASEHMELAFAMDVKEVDPFRHYYALINKLELTFDGSGTEEENMPKTGLLMIVLGVIFMKGNCAQESDIWEVFNMMGVYADKKHFIYGDAKKIITEDLVRLKYLQYRQVPNSNPAIFEFLWGPRAHAETSKMKVLEFLAKIHDTVPSAFPSWYEEALRDEEERFRARAAARARATAVSGVRSRSAAGNFGHSA